VGAVPTEGAAGLYIALANGLFTRASLHVTILSAQNSGILIPAMLHDNVTAAYGAYTAYLSADAIGAASLLVIAPGSALTPGVQQILVRPGSSSHSLADLRPASSRRWSGATPSPPLTRRRCGGSWFPSCTWRRPLPARWPPAASRPRFARRSSCGWPA
jgi:hypothetical protein